MAEAVAELTQDPQLALRQRISNLSPFERRLFAESARQYLEEKDREKLRQKIRDHPNRDKLYKNAVAYLAKNEKKPAGFGSRLARAAVITTGVLTATGGVGYAERDKIGDKILEVGRGFKTSDVVYPSNIFVNGAEYKVDAPTSSPSPTPTETPVPTPSPTPEPTAYPKALAEKEVGNRNIAEFFLGDLVKQFKEKRAKRLENDPEFAKRIRKEFLNSDRINILYLGVDQIRGRGDPNNEGLGRADSIMMISFDPHTFKTIAISIPRDTFSPEMWAFFSDPKMNTMTMINAILEGVNVDSNKLVKKIMENATGIPVDWIIKTNVDFVYDANGTGVFNELFPDGLEINVPNDVVDPDAPVVDGKKGLMFKKGAQKMNGGEIMRYATERRSDSDFGRSDRQRQVIQASMMALFPRIMDDLVKGDTKTLDKLVSTLEKQKESFNLFYDVDLIGIVKTMRDNLTRLRSTPKGIAVLGVLYVNTKDFVAKIRNTPGEMFTSFGLGYGNTPYSLVNAGYEGTTLKLAGSDINNPPLLYWDPLRRRVFELFQ